MRMIGYVLGACVVLAIIQAAAWVLLLALAVSVMIALIRQPREALGLALFVSLTALANERPAVLVAIVGVVMTACLIGKAIERVQPPN